MTFVSQMNAFREAMEAYRQLTNDRSYAAHAKDGRMRLVRVTYDNKGKSTVEPCSEWVPVSEWLKFMESICAS